MASKKPPAADVKGAPTPFNGISIAAKDDRACDLFATPSVVLRVSGSEFGIPYTVLVGGSGRGWEKLGPPGRKARAADRSAIEAAITETFAECDASINEWNPNSEVSRLNSAALGDAVALNQPLDEVLRISDEAHRATDGRFDPTVGALTAAWRDSLDGGEMLSDERVEVLRSRTGWHQLGFAPGSGTVTKSGEGVALDLGGVAKGWVVDALVARLTGLGLRDLLCEWGGDIKAAGSHPVREKPWRVAIYEPPSLAALRGRFYASQDEAAAGEEDQAPLLACLPLRPGRAIAVSGDSAQARKFGFHHVVDPLSGALAKCDAAAPALVAVEADSCALADALATALMAAMSVDEARAWMVAAAGEARLPGGVHRIWAYSRASGELESSAPHAEAQRDVVSRAMLGAMRAIPAAVAVVASTEGRNFAVTATSVVSCSTSPPLVCFNLMQGSRAADALVGPDAAPTQLSICFASADDLAAVEQYSDPVSGAAAEEAAAPGWWHEVTSGRHSWQSLRGAAASLRCEVRTTVSTGSSVTVIAEPLAVHRDEVARTALHYCADRGYYTTLSYRP